MERFRVVPAAYVFFRREQEVLLQLRSGTGFMDDHWAAAAAGHVEEGESVFAAACREAREELGIEILETDLEPLTAMHRTQLNHSWIDERVDFFFTCRSWSGEPRLQEAGKAADLGWFDLAALPHPLVPHEKYVLDRLVEGTLPSISSFGFQTG